MRWRLGHVLILLCFITCLFWSRDANLCHLVVQMNQRSWRVKSDEEEEKMEKKNSDPSHDTSSLLSELKPRFRD